MFSAIKTSVSGLAAASKQVEASASNIANAANRIRPEDADFGGATTGGRNAAPKPEAYRPVRVHQQSQESGGVRSRFVEVDPPHVAGFDPSSPAADEDGLVALPNVNLEEELVNLILAEQAYKANLQPIKAADEMLGQLLDTKT